MDKQNKEPKSACRLPEGIEIKDLCAMKGIWPKRELSQEELLETYKTYYSYVSRREAMLLLNLFLKKYGQNAREAIEEFYYELGKEDGATEKQALGSLLNVVANYSVRPYCYQIHHYQTGPDKKQVGGSLGRLFWPLHVG